MTCIGIARCFVFFFSAEDGIRGAQESRGVGEVYKRQVKEFPLVKKQNFVEYKVQLPEYKEDIVFFKSKRTDRWWMKIPYAVTGSKFSDRHHLMPCGYDDYQRASQGDMPDLWWKTYRKLG